MLDAPAQADTDIVTAARTGLRGVGATGGDSPTEGRSAVPPGMFAVPFRRGRKPRGFTLVEMLVAVAVLLVLASVVWGAGWKMYQSSSLAVSANNIRQLAIGAAAYLGEHNHVFWKYRQVVAGEGDYWWFGFESTASKTAGEGNRTLDPDKGPLAGYIPAGFRPDPSFAFTGKAFKPKFRFGYIGVGYNVLLGGSWMGMAPCLRYWDLEKPEEVVVFATSAQVNTFQAPASARNPMIEEFYGLDQREVTVHGRHGGKAMVAFAGGNAGFLELDPTTLDPRAPKACIGRFAPVGSTQHLR